MKTKSYNFDFYGCNTRNADIGAQIHSPSDMLRSVYNLHDNLVSTVKEISGSNYEIRDMCETDYGFRGIIGKHRATDLPHVAIPGGEEREIPIAPNENLLEKTHFAFHEDFQLLIVQRNFYGISSKNLGKFFSHRGYVTILNPVIEGTDLQQLIQGHIQVKTADIAIARPTNPRLFHDVEHDFNNTIIASLRGTGTATLRLQLRGQAKTQDPERRYLEGSFKRGLIEMFDTFDVKKCKLEIEDEQDNIAHVVDLVADRLIYSKRIQLVGRYPATLEIWEALSEARTEKETELINYFGDTEGERLA